MYDNLKGEKPEGLGTVPAFFMKPLFWGKIAGGGTTYLVKTYSF